MPRTLTTLQLRRKRSRHHRLTKKKICSQLQCIFSARRDAKSNIGYVDSKLTIVIANSEGSYIEQTRLICIAADS
jgi:hypothetical protein